MPANSSGCKSIDEVLIGNPEELAVILIDGSSELEKLDFVLVPRILKLLVQIDAFLS